MSNFKRIDRIAILIQRQLAQIIQKEITDPRIPKIITITEVRVTPDLRQADVYYSAFDKNNAATTIVLNKAASFIRTILAKQIDLRIVPKLHFHYDGTLDYARHLTDLIDKANKDD